MNVQWTGAVMPAMRNWGYKRIDSEEKCPILSESPSEAGYLSTSPGSPVNSDPNNKNPSSICQYLLVPIAEREGVHRAYNTHTGEEFVCKVYPIGRYWDKIRAYSILSEHCNVSGIRDVILGDQKAYVFQEKNCGDMHTFVRRNCRLGEALASRLFYQAASAVAHCHQAGVVLGDLKLRTFVFSNKMRSHLKLESLDNCHILDGQEDTMSSRHGCPAYVSPEILSKSGCYSGKQADVWSLGVILFTLLVGRYPFHDSDPGSLFSKILRGQYCLPDSLSPGAKCLVCSLLRKVPAERLTAAEILIHPWFQSAQETGSPEQEVGPADQTVPLSVQL